MPISGPIITKVTISGVTIDVSGLEATFPGTNIVVKKSTTYPGNYIAKVMGHLGEIKKIPVGAQLFQELLATGKRQNIIYMGVNGNQCAGSAMGYSLLRKFQQNGSLVDFARELNATLGRSGKGKPWLIAQLSATRLPHWDGTSTPLLGGAGNGALNAMVSGAGAVMGKVNSWCAGTALPSIDEMDVLAIVLQEWMAPGVGVGSRVNYDPDKITANGLPRPPHAALFHELMHAYYNAKGMQLGVEESSDENLGGRLFELMAVGLPPFDTRPLSENKFRAVWPGGCLQRMAYP